MSVDQVIRAQAHDWTNVQRDFPAAVLYELQYRNNIYDEFAWEVDFDEDDENYTLDFCSIWMRQPFHSLAVLRNPIANREDLIGELVDRIGGWAALFNQNHPVVYSQAVTYPSTNQPPQAPDRFVPLRRVMSNRNGQWYYFCLRLTSQNNACRLNDFQLGPNSWIRTNGLYCIPANQVQLVNGQVVTAQNLQHVVQIVVDRILDAL